MSSSLNSLTKHLAVASSQSVPIQPPPSSIPTNLIKSPWSLSISPSSSVASPLSLLQPPPSSIPTNLIKSPWSLSISPSSSVAFPLSSL
ncbi:hypothetical protein RIR_jg36046.t1 [Rhizophagus irregularis DAOM 181602=DAOM 197198]|nr:hypothetical protein RIR_jg36046.t1 [Rhizophagus irregularis DAOM 181602=DAOM 197198]